MLCCRAEKCFVQPYCSNENSNATAQERGPCESITRVSSALSVLWRLVSELLLLQPPFQRTLFCGWFPSLKSIVVSTLHVSHSRTSLNVYKLLLNFRHSLISTQIIFISLCANAIFTCTNGLSH